MNIVIIDNHYIDLSLVTDITKIMPYFWQDEEDMKEPPPRGFYFRIFRIGRSKPIQIERITSFYDEESEKFKEDVKKCNELINTMHERIIEHWSSCSKTFTDLTAK